MFSDCGNKMYRFIKFLFKAILLNCLFFNVVTVLGHFDVELIEVPAGGKIRTNVHQQVLESIDTKLNQLSEAVDEKFDKMLTQYGRLSFDFHQLRNQMNYIQTTQMELKEGMQSAMMEKCMDYSEEIRKLDEKVSKVKESVDKMLESNFVDMPDDMDAGLNKNVAEAGTRCQATQNPLLSSSLAEVNRSLSLLTDIFTSFASCDEALGKNKSSGVYQMTAPKYRLPAFEAYCMHSPKSDYTRWTVIQRRSNDPKDFIDFKRSWLEYKNGFGDPNKDHWLGLEKIYALTAQRRHELWIHSVNTAGEAYDAFYNNFAIGSEAERYVIKSVDLATNKGPLANCTNVEFRTYDVDFENYAGRKGGGGFWGPCGVNYNDQRHDENGTKLWLKYNERMVVSVFMAIRPAK